MSSAQTRPEAQVPPENQPPPQPAPLQAPPEGTVERWAWDLVSGCELEAKLSPSPPPERWEHDPPVRRLPAPGRPPELDTLDRSPRTPRPGALTDPRARARLLATFLHHELQAAELAAWALLAFPDTPRAFRAGLLTLVRDELRHLASYRARLAALGAQVGDFPVRDWFWERVPSCQDALSFVALMGLGLEGGNLDHAARFARELRSAGDSESAAVVEQIGHEEEAHVRFAFGWFEHWTGGLDFERWRAALPPPLTPSILRGRSLNRAARRRAGMDSAFLKALERWPNASPGS